MKRAIALALLLATGVSAACSLVYRPSDYFDPSGQLTSIGTVPGGAASIVLTTSLVVYTTNTAIYSLPKGGGEAQTLRTFAFGDLAAIASNGADLVAWCGAMGVEAWQPGGQVVPIDPSASDCTSVDALGATVAAAVTFTTSDASAYEARLYGGPSFAPTAMVPMPDLSATAVTASHAVSLATESAVYYVSGDVIGRNLRSTDKRGYVLANLCPLGGRSGTLREFRVVALADAGIVSYYRANNGSVFSTNDECCSLADGSCPRGTPFISDSYRAVVMRDGQLYILLDDELRRAQLADALGTGAPDAALLRGGLGAVVGSLAVDDEYAFFGAGDRLQRLALPP